MAPRNNSTKTAPSQRSLLSHENPENPQIAAASDSAKIDMFVGMASDGRRECLNSIALHARASHMRDESSRTLRSWLRVTERRDGRGGLTLLKRFCSDQTILWIYSDPATGQE
jgi:hypothetical protein